VPKIVFTINPMSRNESIVGRLYRKSKNTCRFSSFFEVSMFIRGRLFDENPTGIPDHNLKNGTTSSADTPFFILSRADVQAVAQDELGRELTPEEAVSVEQAVHDSIPWMEHIADAITAAGFEP